jgi:hypothetical protein
MTTTELAGADVNADTTATAKDAHDGSHFYSRGVPASAPAPDRAPRDRRYGWTVCQACDWWVPVTGSLTTATHPGCDSSNVEVPLWAVNFSPVNPNGGNITRAPQRGQAARHYKVQPCGSHAGFNRHKAHGEPIDLECQVGERIYQRNRQRRVRTRVKAAA